VIAASDFKQGMRRLASGVSIVTSLDKGGAYCGLVATSVSAVSADPTPSLLVCVNRSASSHDAIRDAGIFCVSILGDAARGVAERFSAPHLRASRFEPCGAFRWTPLVTGAPALEGALASFDCAVAHAFTVNSHTVFVGTVKHLRLWHDSLSPLVYLDGRYAALADAGAAG